MHELGIVFYIIKDVKEAAEELGISERTVYRHMAKKKKA